VPYHDHGKPAATPDLDACLQIQPEDQAYLGPMIASMLKINACYFSVQEFAYYHSNSNPAGIDGNVLKLTNAAGEVLSNQLRDLISSMMMMLEHWTKISRSKGNTCHWNTSSNIVRKPLRYNVANADVGCCVILLGCFR
jgi:hypothetical protein